MVVGVHGAWGWEGISVGAYLMLRNMIESTFNCTDTGAGLASSTGRDRAVVFL